jgi:molybdopterin converting factor small subunit
MKVSVQYSGHLREELGKEESYDLFLDSKSHLLSEILKELFMRKGEKFSKAIYQENGGFNPHITVILNGRVILNDQIEVSDDCNIFFVPFIDGG